MQWYYCTTTCILRECSSRVGVVKEWHKTMIDYIYVYLCITSHPTKALWDRQRQQQLPQIRFLTQGHDCGYYSTPIHLPTPVGLYVHLKFRVVPRDIEASMNILSLLQVSGPKSALIFFDLHILRIFTHLKYSEMNCQAKIKKAETCWNYIFWLRMVGV